MAHITSYTYVYYKKRTLLLMVIGCLCFLLIAGWIVYEKLHGSYTPQELFIVVCGFPFFGTGLYLFVSWLVHKGPAYIITPEGITDCKRGFIPWQEVKEIIIQNGTSPSEKTIHIKLQNPELHFGGKLRSFFGTRVIGLTPALMWYKEFGEPVSCVQLNQR